jgi:hypothetical protein
MHVGVDDAREDGGVGGIVQGTTRADVIEVHDADQFAVQDMDSGGSDPRG